MSVLVLFYLRGLQEPSGRLTRNSVQRLRRSAEGVGFEPTRTRQRPSGFKGAEHCLSASARIPPCQVCAGHRIRGALRSLGISPGPSLGLHDCSAGVLLRVGPDAYPHTSPCRPPNLRTDLEALADAQRITCGKSPLATRTAAPDGVEGPAPVTVGVTDGYLFRAASGFPRQ